MREIRSEFGEVLKKKEIVININNGNVVYLSHRHRGSDNKRVFEFQPFPYDVTKSFSEIYKDMMAIKSGYHKERASKEELIRAREERKEKRIEDQWAAIRWFRENIKNDTSYQEYAKETGDKGLYKLAEIYTIKNANMLSGTTGYIDPEEITKLFELIKRYNTESVFRACRKGVESDENLHTGIFPDKVFEVRRKREEEEREAQIEHSKQIIDQHIKDIIEKRDTELNNDNDSGDDDDENEELAAVPF